MVAWQATQLEKSCGAQWYLQVTEAVRAARPSRDGWGSLARRTTCTSTCLGPGLAAPWSRSPLRWTPRCGRPNSTDLWLAWFPRSVGQGSPSQDRRRFDWQLPVAHENSRPQEEMEGSGPRREGAPGALEGHPGDRNVCAGPRAPNEEVPHRRYGRGNGHAPGAAESPRGRNQQDPRTRVLKTFQPQAKGLASGWDPEPWASLQLLSGSREQRVQGCGRCPHPGGRHQAPVCLGTPRGITGEWNQSELFLLNCVLPDSCAVVGDGSLKR